MSGHFKALLAVFAFLPSNALVLILFQSDFHHEFNLGYSFVLSLNSSWLCLETFCGVLLERPAFQELDITLCRRADNRSRNED